MKKLVLLLPLLFCACAEMQKDYEAKNCNYDGAFQAGVNAGQNGQEMNGDKIAYFCPDENKAEVRTAYREGYMTSKKDAAPTALVNALLGRAPAETPKCHARAGQEAHQSFCRNLNQATCPAHSSLCFWH